MGLRVPLKAHYRPKPEVCYICIIIAVVSLVINSSESAGRDELKREEYRTANWGPRHPISRASSSHQRRRGTQEDRHLDDNVRGLLSIPKHLFSLLWH